MPRWFPAEKSRQPAGRREPCGSLRKTSTFFWERLYKGASVLGYSRWLSPLFWQLFWSVSLVHKYSRPIKHTCVCGDFFPLPFHWSIHIVCQSQSRVCMWWRFSPLFHWFIHIVGQPQSHARMLWRCDHTARGGPCRDCCLLDAPIFVCQVHLFLCVRCTSFCVSHSPLFVF